MRALLAAVILSLLVTAVGVACIFVLTAWSLEALRRVPPLSREAAALVWSYALAFTALVVVVLAVVALILAIAEAARRYRAAVSG